MTGWQPSRRPGALVGCGHRPPHAQACLCRESAEDPRRGEAARRRELSSGTWRRSCFRSPIATSTSPRSPCLEAAREAGHELGVRDRGRRDACVRSAAAHRRACSASSARGPSRSRSTASSSRRPRSRAAAVERLPTPRDFDALFLAGGHAPGMRQYLGSERGPARSRATFFATQPSRSPRSAMACSSPRARKRADGSSRAARPTHDLPAEVHGARRVLLDVLAARPLLPDLSGVRRGRGPRRARAARGLRARAARAVEARHARRRHATRSSSRTAATSRRAGPATRT